MFYKSSVFGILMQKKYDLIIVGGGITGSALLYTMSNYTNISSILLIEKHENLALLNSNPKSNSQTLHFGDVETNYTQEKAKIIKEEATKILKYCDTLNPTEKNSIIKKCQKIVLGVGDEEVNSLEKTYESGISKLFPGLKKAYKNTLLKIEPNVVKGRQKDEKIMALVSAKGYMVNFENLSKSLVKDAIKNPKARIDILFSTHVYSASKKKDIYTLLTNKGTFKCEFVVFATGSYSLLFAKSLGCDKNLSIISVGGNYFVSKRILNGKVYRVQKGGIPFAAIHADPDITNPNITRYGPTVTLPLELERKGNTSIDYLRSFDYDIKTADTLFDVLMNKDIRRIIMTNGVYGIPLIGKKFFFKNEVKKIIPSIKYENLWYGRGMGGIRPQVIDEDKRFFALGASKAIKDKAIFNITPSPGATSALGSALNDLKYISEKLDIKILINKYEKILGKYR